MLELPFGLTIDFSLWLWFISLPVPTAAAVILALGAWTAIAYWIFKQGAELWEKYREEKNTAHWEWVLLAVDIPPLFIQTPKAVEQIFAHLSGALAHIDVAGKFWHGKKQKPFSFEIISIEGYIQFLVRTEKEYRDLLEASIYAQYTEAQITEVEDYIIDLPDKYPNPDYDVMGVEFTLADDDVFPIRTYEHFEYQISKDAVFSDPMAAILENFARIGVGENLWLQIVVEPVSDSWKEEGIEKAKELLAGGGGGHGHGGGGVSKILSKAMEVPGAIFKDVAVHGLGLALGESEEGGHEEEEGESITPGMRKTVETIEQKIEKIGFKCKLRLLYAAKKGAYSPNRCVEGFIGAMNQFRIQSANGLVPWMSTHAHYDPKHTKSNKLKNTFVKVFKKRKMKWKTCGGYILNIEELATVWHFPLPFVKTPLLAKAGHKKAEPPSGLPTETIENPLRIKGATPPKSVEPPAPPPLEYG